MAEAKPILDPVMVTQPTNLSCGKDIHAILQPL
jgi:hypothetical protein